LPLYDYQCKGCGFVFESFHKIEAPSSPCPNCGSERVSKLLSPVGVQVKTDAAEGRVKKRLRSYLKDGKHKDAVRFADKAASMLKSDKAKRMAEGVRKRKSSSKKT
jgi:putative FmdB family regulatory protein